VVFYAVAKLAWRGKEYRVVIAMVMMGRIELVKLLIRISAMPRRNPPPLHGGYHDGFKLWLDYFDAHHTGGENLHSNTTLRKLRTLHIRLEYTPDTTPTPTQHIL
jgi:hypothetical protein